MAVMEAGPALRFVRAVMFSVVCVAVSGLGHAHMSGGTLPLPVLVAALLPATGAGWWLAGRERHASVVVAASALGQVFLHALFSSLPSCLPGARAATGHTMAGHHTGPVGHSDHGVTAESPSDPMAVVAAFDGSVFTTGMAAAHLVAGLVCGWWLWRGERALVRLGRSLALFVCAPLWTALRLWSVGSPVGPVTRWRTRRRPGRRLQDLLLLHGLSLRGPPPYVLPVRPSPAR